MSARGSAPLPPEFYVSCRACNLERWYEGHVQYVMLYGFGGTADKERKRKDNSRI